jgi:transcriptional regulator with XRE-family HTH domain
MKLSEYRRSRDLTQQQVAEELGIESKGYVSRLETGAQEVPIELALRIEHWSGRKVLAVELLPAERAQWLRAAIEGAGGKVPAEAVSA